MKTGSSDDSAGPPEVITNTLSTNLYASMNRMMNARSGVRNRRLFYFPLLPESFARSRYLPKASWLDRNPWCFGRSSAASKTPRLPPTMPTIKLKIKTGNVTLDADYTGTNPDVEPGQYVAISVTDTGFGMPEDVVALAFEPFFTTKDVGVGTGLGLSMVFGFSKQSLGHIDLQSTEGQGTSVTIYLPREVNEHSTDRPDKAAERTDDPCGSETVLVVEDNDGVREVSVSMLDQLGYKIVQARSGVEALNMLSERDDIALVFTDMVMPENVSGSELAAKALAIRPDLAFVFTSGFADGAAMRQLHGTAFLSKPFSMSDLANAIRDALDGRTGKSHLSPAA